MTPYRIVMMGGDQAADNSIFKTPQGGAGIDTTALFKHLAGAPQQQTSGGSLAEQILQNGGRTPDTRPAPQQPARQPDTTQRQPDTTQRQPDTTQRPDAGQQRPEVFSPPQDVRRPTDANIQNGALTLSYNDPEFDRKMRSSDQYHTLKITDMPQNVTIRHWVDRNGYFFYFQNGGDGNKLHYYPANAKVINVGGAEQNLTLERMKVNDAFAKQHGTFQSMKKDDNVISYLAKMSKYGSDALDIQEKSLTESAANSTNPYFKIFLSDIHVAKAMKPIVDQMTRTGQANPNNPETLAQLNKAIELLQTVQRDSRTGLGKINKFPPQNTVLPMDPYDVYGRNPDGYYLFWGGSLDQARHREVQITMLRDLIKSNALPKFELPPALPPRMQ